MGIRNSITLSYLCINVYMYLVTDTLIKIMYNSINLESKKIILSLIVAIAFCIVACSTFVHFEMDDNYFQLLPMSIGVGVVAVIAVLSCFISKEIQRFCFTLPDILFIVIVVYYVTRYDYELQLANWKIIYAVLLLLLWFAARIILSNLAISKSILLGGFVGIGCVLAVWGMLQLYGVQRSNNYLFPITGPFYNPGPYSGYLAMIFPISLSCLLQAKGCVRYGWFIPLSFMLCILPAGMSRSAWIALFVGCIWLLAVRNECFRKLNVYIKAHLRVAILYVSLLLCILFFILLSLFRLKSDSANGRLFIWKNTCEAVSSRPLLGYGAGSFPSVYGKMQSKHFASGNYTELEEKVAGSPDYAFNEYLQICIEGGFILLFLFLTLVICGICRGVRNKEYAACSGLLSLLVFSLSSYPFQVPPFLISGVLLLAICVSGSNNILFRRRQRFPPFLLSAITLSGVILMSTLLYKIPEISKRWESICSLYERGLFKEATLECEELYKYQKHNSVFLIKYAQCLMKQEKYDAACEILERAKLTSCHPVIWNLQGQYHQSAGNYAKAEKCFKQAVDLLPGRIYPYFLLAKLYSEPSFFYEDKMREMANIVLNKKPKVSSMAIDEMRLEVRKLLTRLPRSDM